MNALFRNAELIIVWAIGAIFGACLTFIVLFKPAHAEEFRAPYCYMLMMQTEVDVTIDWPCVEAIAAGQFRDVSVGDRMVARALIATRRGK